MSNTYDYIIIGGGSTGCAVAGRLADSGADSVALLEAGGHDHKMSVTCPMGIVATVPKTGPHNYNYQTMPQPGVSNRKGYQPRGRGLGGSSSINGMVYIRGTPGDYAHWAALGCDGWGWQDVLPYFKRSERNERLGGQAEDALHGGRGPLHVSDQRYISPFARRFVEAAESAGHPYNHDFNGTTQEGVGYYQVTQRDGERWNSARAYLHQGDASDTGLNGGRRNLHVLPDTQVLRIVFEGKRAVGVEVIRDGQQQTLRANREIILSAGSFGSPQLLMTSGIGPAEHLRELGIEVVHDAPSVGQNLQEHCDLMLHHQVHSTDLFGASLGGIVRLLKELQRYRRERDGMLTVCLTQAGVFVKSRPDLAEPDLQLHFMITLGDRKKRSLHGYACHVCVLRPHSRGQVLLTSADARVSPKIDQNLLADPRDVETLLAGARIVNRILEQKPLARFGGKAYLRDNVRFDGTDDDAARDLLRKRTDIVFHPVGTCRMGSDAASVVDPQLRVRGVEGLRVADASIMPTLIGGNTNATAIMIGEKASDLIRGITRINDREVQLKEAMSTAA